MTLKKIINQNSGTISIIAFIIFCGMFFLNNKYQSDKRIQKILKGYTLVNAKVQYVNYINKRGFKIVFSYQINGQENFSSVCSEKYRKIRNVIIDRNFPAIVSNSEHSVNDLLIFPNDFTRYGMSFPDSLSWVKEYE